MAATQPTISFPQNIKQLKPALRIAGTVGIHRMKLRHFIFKEVKDRALQKDFLSALFNIITFPVTTAMNYYSYRSWIKLLVKLGIEEKDLGEKVAISIIEESVSFWNTIKKHPETQPYLRVNEGYVIEKDEVFIFPCHTPKTIHDFYTIIHEPFIIGLSNSKHPYETLWDIPTLTKITKFEIIGNWTNIDLRGELFDNKIELRINKKLRLPTLAIHNARIVLP